MKPVRTCQIGTTPTIYGDGEQSRDFTYVSNAVVANLLALKTTRSDALNQVYNIACGTQTSLNELWKKIKELAGSDLDVKYGPARLGDVQHSLADISKAAWYLNYLPEVNVVAGLERTYDWFLERKGVTV